MWFRKHDEKSFVGVALAFILIGSAIFTFGIIAWLFNVYSQDTLIAFPSLKIMGGLVITALGYIQLEISLLRRK